MIRKLFAGFALALLTLTASAAEIDTRNLSDAQVAELKAMAAKASADNEKQKAGATVTPGNALSTAATWGKQASEAAEGFGRAFTTAARELGITVNEFLATDAGKLTAALIIWKVVGGSMLKLVFILFMWTVGGIAIRIIYKRLFTGGFKESTYSHFGGAFTGTKLVSTPRSIKDLNTDGEWLALWIMIIVAALMVLITGVCLA